MICKLKTSPAGHHPSPPAPASIPRPPVRATLVVIHGVLIQGRMQVPWPGDRHPVGNLCPGCAPSVRHRHSPADSVVGSSLPRVPSLADTVPDASVNCPAWPPIRNRERPHGLR